MQNELKISFRDVMAPAFRRHARGEAFRTLTRQPEPPQEAVRRWQMPWMYLRLFGILLLMAAVCLACIWLDIGALPAPYIYAFFWCGSLFPLTLAMFLWELDPFVNISIFEMMGLALLSGLMLAALHNALRWTLGLPGAFGVVAMVVGGIFVGMVASALGEILEVAPVLMRRFRLGDVSGAVRVTILLTKTLGAIIASIAITL